MKRKPRTSHTKRRPSYELLEPRNLLAGDILVGNLNSGIAVSDNSTGTGYIMYSETDVHSRFSSVPSNNADHFVATRLNGLQWQYNNDANWINFAPVESDHLVADINYDSDTIARLELSRFPDAPVFDSARPLIIQSILSGYVEGDLRFAANRFGGVIDNGEFQILGSSFSKPEYAANSLASSGLKIGIIGSAALSYEFATGELPRAATIDDAGVPLLSWRVQLLPYLGMQNLYDQFNLDEPWDSTNNLPLASQMPDIFASPHFSSTSETSFLAVTGSGTLFPAFGPGINTFEDIPDGAHTTLMFVEANPDRAVIWSQPGDLEFDPADPLDGVGNIDPEGFAIATSRGSNLLPPTFDAQNFANMALRDDGNFVDFSNFVHTYPAHFGLSQINLGTIEFQSRFNRLPAHAIYSDDGGTPLLSWRVAILPYIEHQDLYDQFHLDEPWDSPHNLSLLPMMPLAYMHPDIENGMTNFLAVSGPGTMFPIENSNIGFDQIFDGLRNTVAFVEANTDQAVEWTKPQDLLVDLADPKNGLGGIEMDGFNVSFAGGQQRFIENSIPDVEFAKMLTIDGGEVADFSEVFGLQRAETQLQDLAYAALNYESSHQEFPGHATYSSSGSPLLSWRVELLPFIEQRPLYDMFHHDEPWDSPHNLSLLPLMPEAFASADLADGFTVFQAANGPSTIFPASDTQTTRQSITDGEKNTALFMKVNNDRAVEWTRPADLTFDPTNPGDGLGDSTAAGFEFVTADGKFHFYNNALDREPLEFLLQLNDETPVAPEYVQDLSDNHWGYQVENKLRELSHAALNYESATSRLPAHAIYSPPISSGTPMLSWRVELLPFLDHQPLYDLFHLDEPWDSVHNLSLLPLMPDVFAHPFVEDGLTVFQAVTSNLGDPETAFSINYRGLSLQSFTDGLSNTALFVEADLDRAVEWTKPEDILFNINDPKSGLETAFLKYGSHFALADGSTKFYRNCVSPEYMANLLLRADGNLIDSDNYDCDAGVPATVAKASLSYAGGVEATDKKPLLPGETATFENYTSYIDGITSLNIDIGRLDDPDSITADDFVFRTGNGNNLSDFSTITLMPMINATEGAGDNESTRISLTFPDGSITNTWLQVTVKANDNTGLSVPSLFYFGNAIGETGNNATDARVNLLDVALTRANQTGFTSAGIDNPYDFNRDSRVNLIDVALARANQSGFSSLNLITAPGSSNRSSGNLFDTNTKGNDSSRDNDSSQGNFAAFVFAETRQRDELTDHNSKQFCEPRINQAPNLSDSVTHRSLPVTLEIDWRSVDLASMDELNSLGLDSAEFKTNELTTMDFDSELTK